jgi:hypothetical protein
LDERTKDCEDNTAGDEQRQHEGGFDGGSAREAVGAKQAAIREIRRPQASQQLPMISRINATDPAVKDQPTP